MLRCVRFGPRIAQTRKVLAFSAYQLKILVEYPRFDGTINRMLPKIAQAKIGVILRHKGFMRLMR
jgi:hypothetical protein